MRKIDRDLPDVLLPPHHHPVAFEHCLSMYWLLLAASAVVTLSVLPQSREKVKDVPWTPLALAIGLSVLGDKISDGIRCIGTGSMQQIEERHKAHNLHDL